MPCWGGNSQFLESGREEPKREERAARIQGNKEGMENENLQEGFIPANGVVNGLMADARETRTKEKYLQLEVTEEPQERGFNIYFLSWVLEVRGQ